MNDPELMPFLNRLHIISKEEHLKWYESLKGRKDILNFAIEQKSERVHVGNVWLWQIDRVHQKAEIRIVIGALDQCGRGIGSEALIALTNYAFKNMQLHKLYAYVLAFNSRALRAFQKAHYTIEGTLKSDRWSGKEFVDVHLLGSINPNFSFPS
jgi:RimJ/RimL family protein N-acetyltransferase